MNKDRNKQGQFTTGNTCGQCSQFRKGTSGNLKGRPPNAKRWLRAYADQPANAIRAKLAELARQPDASKRRRTRIPLNIGVHLLLRRGQSPVSTTPVPGSTPIRGKVYDYRLVNKSKPELLVIYHNPNEHPDRREGARLRLIWPWEHGTW